MSEAEGIGRAAAVTPPPAGGAPGGPAGPPVPRGFSEVLEGQALTFSRHAQKRLKSRHLELSSEDLARVSQAADKARDKGSRESLFLLDRLGLIVNVERRVVLTAVDTSSEDRIFTNIDSTVVISRS